MKLNSMLGQYTNAPCPMLERVLGRVTDVICSQCSNAAIPISVSPESPKSSETRGISLNANGAIPMLVLGNVTLVNS